MVENLALQATNKTFDHDNAASMTVGKFLGMVFYGGKHFVHFKQPWETFVQFKRPLKVFSHVDSASITVNKF